MHPSPLAAAGHPAPPAGGLAFPPYHLAHRPSTPEGYVLGAATADVQNFVLASALPDEHPLYCDGPGRSHDPTFVLDLLGRATQFVAQRYLKVPATRRMLIATSGVEVTGLAPWRRRPSGAGALELDIALHRKDVIDGVPRGATAEITVRVDGERCGRALAHATFASPGVYRSMRATARRASVDGAALTGGRLQPLPAELVGRCDPFNVLVAAPMAVTPLKSDAGVPLHLVVLPTAVDDEGDCVPAAQLMEATRQAALYAAHRHHGVDAASAVVTSWHAAFAGFAEPDLPVDCVVRGLPLQRAFGDRPEVVCEIELTQGGRPVATVRVHVTQDV